jgi:cytoskeletal protein CcmA (bactofilin family)
VTGNIESADGRMITVAIGPSGRVFGDIKAYRVKVAGKVDGNIFAIERAEFHKDAEVLGDVTYGTIAIEHGAKLLGMVVQSHNGSSSSTDK